eukprot:7174364-Prymnesium_polylepis.2
MLPLRFRPSECCVPCHTVGGYRSLSGNTPSLALKALTGCVGDKLLTLVRDASRPEQWTCTSPSFGDLASRSCTLRPAAWPHSDYDVAAGREDDVERNIGQIHGLLQALQQEGAVICAGTADDGDREVGAPETVNALGVVSGHSYSVLRIATNVAGSGFDLLQLRNPWGGIEWAGDWSDHSHMWSKYPAVEEALGHGQEQRHEDGIFWMSKEDFTQTFERICICRFDAEAQRKQLAREQLPPVALEIEVIVAPACASRARSHMHC